MTRRLVMLFAGAAAITCMSGGSGTAFAQAGCIQFDNNGGAWSIYNRCEYRLNVTWWDQGNCRNGCSANVLPSRTNRSYRILAPVGNYRFRAERY